MKAVITAAMIRITIIPKSPPSLDRRYMPANQTIAKLTIASIKLGFPYCAMIPPTKGRAVKMFHMGVLNDGFKTVVLEPKAFITRFAIKLIRKLVVFGPLDD